MKREDISKIVNNIGDNQPELKENATILVEVMNILGDDKYSFEGFNFLNRKVFINLYLKENKNISFYVEIGDEVWIDCRKISTYQWFKDAEKIAKSIKDFTDISLTKEALVFFQNILDRKIERACDEYFDYVSNRDFDMVKEKLNTLKK